MSRSPHPDGTDDGSLRLLAISEEKRQAVTTSANAAPSNSDTTSAIAVAVQTSSSVLLYDITNDCKKGGLLRFLRSCRGHSASPDRAFDRADVVRHHVGSRRLALTITEIVVGGRPQPALFRRLDEEPHARSSWPVRAAWLARVRSRR